MDKFLNIKGNYAMCHCERRRRIIIYSQNSTCQLSHISCIILMSIVRISRISFLFILDFIILLSIRFVYKYRVSNNVRLCILFLKFSVGIKLNMSDFEGSNVRSRSSVKSNVHE